MKETLSETGSHLLPQFIYDEMVVAWLDSTNYAYYTDWPADRIKPTDLARTRTIELARIQTIDFVRNPKLAELFGRVTSPELRKLAEAPHLRELMNRYEGLTGQKFIRFQDFAGEVSLGVDTDSTDIPDLQRRFCALLIAEWNEANKEPDGRGHWTQCIILCLVSIREGRLIK